LLKAAATSHELAANDLLDAAEGGVRILESVWSTSPARTDTAIKNIERRNFIVRHSPLIVVKKGICHPG
jgi:hypothetical protein